MAWVSGSAKRTFEIRAPMAQVYEFLTTPDQIVEALEDLERREMFDPSTARFIYKARTEKGVTFQGDCTVRYSGNGTDRVKWEPHGDGPCSLTCTGSAVLREGGPGVTEVTYEENSSTDLPIPKLLARVFRPILAREVKKDVYAYLDRVKAVIERRVT